MLNRLIVRAAVVLASAVASAGAVPAQTEPQQGPMPPLHDLVLCAIQFEKLLGPGEGVTADQRAATVSTIEALYRQNRYETIARVESERGPLAWSLWIPGEPSAAESRLLELHGGSCMRQSLRRGAESSDPVTQSRARELLNRYEETPVLSEGFFVDGVSTAVLRLELPPSELIVPGGLIAGRVVIADDELDGVPTAVEALGEGLLAEVDGQTARVTGEGLFALRAPAQPGTYTVAVRHQARPLLVPVESSFTIVRRGAGAGSPRATTGAEPTAVDLPKPPEVDCPGFDRHLDAMLAGDESAAAPADCSIAVPRVVLPDQRLIVLGRLGNRSGRATRAFVGPSEVPLLARTPIAAVFDVSAVPAGLHVFTLYEGASLQAAAPVRRVRLTASSDRQQLASGEVATFEVRIEGLPRPQSGGRGAAGDRGGRAVAFLDYVNRSPEIGKFQEHPDRFTVPIAPAALTPGTEPLSIEDQSTLLARIEKMVSMVGDPSGGPATGAATSGAFADVQRYRGAGDGEYHVQLGVRLPDEMSRHAPATVAPSGIDDRGSFATIEGGKLYFSQGESAESRVATLEGPQATSLFDSSCSGICQCSIQSWEYSDEVAAQVAALDRSRPEWRSVTATVPACGCDQARAACYGALSLECRTRCKSFLESSRTDHVSGFAIEPNLGACRDRGVACGR